jgi:nucleoside-diphosphate-sugar epimerase
LKVLVTGATGFVGSQVARELVRRGHEVRASVLPGAGLEAIADLSGRIELVDCDLWDCTPRQRADLCGSVELCIHAAWYAVPGEYLASAENLRCVQGSLALLEALAAAGCGRAAFLGTCFEYRFGADPLAETDPVAPGSLYAAAKLATRYLGEQLARARGMRFLWPRLFYLYGPFEDPRRLVPSVIRALLRGEPVDVTRGLQVRDFLHVRDVGAAVVAAALGDLEGVVNIGSGDPVTVRDVVSTIESVIGCEGLVRYGGRPDNPTDPPCVCADNRRLVAGTGWSPSFDLRGGLQDAVAWWKTRPIAG